MRNLGHYVLRGYKQATWVALLCTLLPLFNSIGLLVSWLGVAILGLVTLRKGPVQGLLVLIWIAMPALVLTVLKQPQLLIGDVLCGSFLIWLLAWVLRVEVSWVSVLYLATGLGILAVILAHSTLGQVSEHWEPWLKVYLQQINQQVGAEWDPSKIQILAKNIARFATGLQVSGILLGNLFNLLFARWWQALLFNPGGLSGELLSLRLGPLALGVVALTGLAILLGNLLAFDILPVVLLPFMLAGFSLVHSVIIPSHYRWTWLFIFYGLLLLFLPYILLVLISLASIDIVLNLRQRWRSNY